MTVNDIEILQEMLSCKAQVPLQQEQGSTYVELTDKQATTNVKIEEIPHNSIVIRADAFEFKSPVFAGSKNERRRADFVIVANEDTKKWIICIEIKRGNIRERNEVIAQLRGARCIMDYCTSVGREFWGTKGFLQGYEYRFIGIANINPTPLTRSSTFDIQSQGALHSCPDVFLAILGRADLSFRHLIDETP